MKNYEIKIFGEHWNCIHTETIEAINGSEADRMAEKIEKEFENKGREVYGTMVKPANG